MSNARQAPHYTAYQPDNRCCKRMVQAHPEAVSEAWARRNGVSCGCMHAASYDVAQQSLKAASASARDDASAGRQQLDMPVQGNIGPTKNSESFKQHADTAAHDTTRHDTTRHEPKPNSKALGGNTTCPVHAAHPVLVSKQGSC
jgi:hypothetical protein